MKVELIKCHDDSTNIDWWKIVRDGFFVSCYRTEAEGIESFDKYVERMKEPKQEPEIIKSITL